MVDITPCSLIHWRMFLCLTEHCVDRDNETVHWRMSDFVLCNADIIYVRSHIAPVTKKR